jgi:hypothetical protein
MLLNHTGCGFTTFTDEELNAKLSASSFTHYRAAGAPDCARERASSGLLTSFFAYTHRTASLG